MKTLLYSPSPKLTRWRSIHDASRSLFSPFFGVNALPLQLFIALDRATTKYKQILLDDNGIATIEGTSYLDIDLT